MDKAADLLLAFPRVMWLQRSVSVQTVAEKPIVKDQEAKSFNQFWADLNYLNLSVGVVALPIYAAIYLATSLIALPLLGLGLICKKIAMDRDPKSNQYYKLIKIILKNPISWKTNQKLLENKAKIQEEVEKINKNLQKLAISANSNPSLKNLIATKREELEAQKKKAEAVIEDIDLQIKDGIGFAQQKKTQIENDLNKIEPELRDLTIHKKLPGINAKEINRALKVLKPQKKQLEQKLRFYSHKIELLKKDQHLHNKFDQIFAEFKI